MCVHVFPLTYKKCHKPNRIDEKHKQTNDTVFFRKERKKKVKKKKLVKVLTSSFLIS